MITANIEKRDRAYSYAVGGRPKRVLNAIGAAAALAQAGQGITTDVRIGSIAAIR
jgi:hypothetical protein